MQVPLERFYIYSAACGIVLTALLYFVGAPMLALPGALLVGGLGLPRCGEFPNVHKQSAVTAERDYCFPRSGDLSADRHRQRLANAAR